ncbi:MAG: phosphoesterase, partial [Candidatus Eremiobacteraeota bacterium]|nr:phosphoesterase [Candidatus Eremiobacteraeota bacterium]
IDLDGTMRTLRPFRIGPHEFAADTDDLDHAHGPMLQKMHIVDAVPRMDQFAMTEIRKRSPTGNPSLQAKQFGELAMAHEDCDTIPFLWRYAKRFVLFDHYFESISGPSTPGNLSIFGAQTGITQWVLHPDEAAAANGDRGAGVPVVNDADPFWGSPSDKTIHPLPVNPGDFPAYETQRNLTYATLALTLQGRSLPSVVRADTDPAHDLRDVARDISHLGAYGVSRSVPWGWYEEGFDREPTDDNAGPLDAQGRHASYVTHHNSPQYFGYVANNAAMRAHLHGLSDFLISLDKHTLPPQGGVYYVKGGYRNIFRLTPADPDPSVQKAFLGDDDHPGYSDSQISEAMIAEMVNRIARSPYWQRSAIIVTWDDSEGDYDHVPPPLRFAIQGEAWVSDGPRVPLLLISPYSKTNSIQSNFGDHGSVVKFVEAVFGLEPLATLPDESRSRALALERFGVDTLGPTDSPDNGVTNLLSAFDVGKLSGAVSPLGAQYAEIPESLVRTLPQQSGYGCKDIRIVPTDLQTGIQNRIPADFNPRPRTNPTNK